MLIIDANIVVKWIAFEPGRDAVVDRLEREVTLIAPEFLLLETGHALWRKVKTGLMDRVDAEESLATLPGFFEELAPTASLFPAATRLSFELDHWIYDTLYLALAVARGVNLLTADRKFANAAKQAGYGEAVELLTWEGQTG